MAALHLIASAYAFPLVDEARGAASAESLRRFLGRTRRSLRDAQLPELLPLTLLPRTEFVIISISLIIRRETFALEHNFS